MYKFRQEAYRPSAFLVFLLKAYFCSKDKTLMFYYVVRWEHKNKH